MRPCVVYAVGDIHGRADLLAEIRALIREDAARRKAKRRVLVHLGDYVSRGPDSRGVIDMLVHDPLPGFESVHLKGNHETIMLEFLAGSLGAGRHWLHFGGGATLESYGIPGLEPLEATDVDIERMRRTLADRMSPAHRRFLATLAVSHREDGWFFAHAGVRPGVPLDEQQEGDLVWIRRAFLDSDADHGAVVVHGHCIAPEPELRPNRIGLDTGAYATGRLSCAILDGGRATLIQTGTSASGSPTSGGYVAYGDSP